MAIPEIEIPFKIQWWDSLAFLNRLEKAMLRGSTQAQKLVNKLNLKGTDSRYLDEYATKVQKLNQEFRESGGSVAQYEIELSKLKDELRENARNSDRMEKALESARVSADKFINKMENRDYGKDAIDNYKNELEKLTQEFKDWELSAKEYRWELQKLKKNTKDNNKQSTIFNTSLSKIRNSIAKVVWAYYALREAARVVVTVTKKAIEYERAWADVEKRLETSAKKSSELKNELLNLSERVTSSFTELAKIAETAGQLGIAAENIWQFTESIAGFSRITGKSAEEAAESFGVLIKATGGTADEIEWLVANAVALGSNFATNEQQIATFAKRIAGAGSVANIASKDLLAIGTAFSQIGIPAQRGGTAVSRVLLKLSGHIQKNGEDLEKLAGLVGKTTEEIETQFEEAGGSAALLWDIIDSLSDWWVEAKDTFEDLFGSNIRTTQSFLTAANNADEYQKTLQRVGDTEDNILKNKSKLNDLYNTEAERIKRTNDRYDNLKARIGNTFKGAVVDATESIVGLETAWDNVSVSEDSYLSQNGSTRTALRVTNKRLETLTHNFEAYNDRVSTLSTILEKTESKIRDTTSELSTLDSSSANYRDELQALQEQFVSQADIYVKYLDLLRQSTNDIETLTNVQSALYNVVRTGEKDFNLTGDSIEQYKSVLNATEKELKMQEQAQKTVNNLTRDFSGTLKDIAASKVENKVNSISKHFQNLWQSVWYTNTQLGWFFMQMSGLGGKLLNRLWLSEVSQNQETPQQFFTEDLENETLKQKRLYKEAQDNVNTLKDAMESLETKETLTAEEIEQWSDYNKQLQEAEKVVKSYEDVSSDVEKGWADEEDIEKEKTFVELIKEAEKEIEQENEANSKKSRLIKAIMEDQNVWLKEATKLYSRIWPQIQATADKIEEWKDAEADKNEEINEWIEDSVDSIKDYEDEIDELQNKMSEFTEEVTQDIRDMNNEIGELDIEMSDLQSERQIELWERRVELLEEEEEVEKKLNDLDSVDNDDYWEERKEYKNQLKDIEKELQFITENTTEAEREAAEVLADRSESKKLLDDYNKRIEKIQEEKNALKERKAIASAIRDEDRWVQIQKEWDKIVATYENEKWEIKEVTDYKNIKYAQDLQNRKSLLQDQLYLVKTMYNNEVSALEEKLISKIKLEREYSGLYTKEISKRIAKVKKLASWLEDVKSLQKDVGLETETNNKWNNQPDDNITSNRNTNINQVNINNDVDYESFKRDLSK